MSHFKIYRAQLNSNIKIFIITILHFALISCVSNEIKPVDNTHNPKAAAYNVQLGLAYLEQDNRQRAKQKLLMAMAEDPNSPAVNDALAYYFEKTQDFPDADKYYQQAVQLDPKAGAALNNYGAFLCRQAHYKEANAYFLKAIADTQYVNTALAYENAGLCAVAANQWDDAKHYFKKALAQDPSLQQSSEELAKIS